MKKIGATTSGTVIVEMTEAEFTRLEKSPAFATGAEKLMSHAERVAYARERLKKLDPQTKKAAINSIEAMFQFHGGIASEEVERVIASLQKERFLSIDAQSRLRFRSD